MSGSAAWIGLQAPPNAPDCRVPVPAASTHAILWARAGTAKRPSRSHAKPHQAVCCRARRISQPPKFERFAKARAIVAGLQAGRVGGITCAHAPLVAKLVRIPERRLQFGTARGLDATCAVFVAANHVACAATRPRQGLRFARRFVEPTAIVGISGRIASEGRRGKAAKVSLRFGIAPRRDSEGGLAPAHAIVDAKEMPLRTVPSIFSFGETWKVGGALWRSHVLARGLARVRSAGTAPSVASGSPVGSFGPAARQQNHHRPPGNPPHFEILARPCSFGTRPSSAVRVVWFSFRGVGDIECDR